METTRASNPARPLPIVAGHIALDLVDTVDYPDDPQRFDHLGSYADLLRWAQSVGVVGRSRAGVLSRAAVANPRDAAAALRKAHRLRGVLTDVFTAVATNADPAPYWPPLRSFAADALAHAGLTADADAYDLAWPRDEFAALLWPIATAAVQLLTSPASNRVKQCAGCPWLFLDQSKNGSRRWCAMGDCGTDAKMARYVARRAQRRVNS
jgi:predicted RNA-binding Zn ribbon-like protein